MDRLLSRIEYITDTLAITALFACMLLVTVDVFCRYALLSPLSFSMDLLVLYILPAIFFLGLPGSYAKGSHIAVDLLCNFLPASGRLTLSIFARAVTILVFLTIAWFGGLRFLEAFRLGEVQPGIVANWPIWPSVLLVPLGTALATLRAAERFVHETMTFFEGKDRIQAYVRETAHEEVFPE